MVKFVLVMLVSVSDMQDKIYVKLEGECVDISEVKRKVDAIMRLKLNVECNEIIEIVNGYRTIYECSVNTKPGYLAAAKKISEKEFLVYIFSKVDGIKYTYEAVDRKVTVSAWITSDTATYKMLKRITLADTREFFR